MNVFGVGLPEMILIFVVALLIFGPKKLPEIGRSVGKAIRGFQDASREFENEFKREMDQQESRPPEQPMRATIEPPQALSPAPHSSSIPESPEPESMATQDVVGQDGVAPEPIPSQESITDQVDQDQKANVEVEGEVEGEVAIAQSETSETIESSPTSQS